MTVTEPHEAGGSDRWAAIGGRGRYLGRQGGGGSLMTGFFIDGVVGANTAKADLALERPRTARKKSTSRAPAPRCAQVLLASSLLLVQLKGRMA